MIVLYPIKPRYIERILEGQKKCELRRRLPRCKLNYIILYATTPVSRIVGYAEVEAVYDMSHKDLWNRVSHIAGVSHEEYQSYFEGSEQACAIKFRSVYKFNRPFLIDNLLPDIQVPQSFCYIDQKVFDRIKRRKGSFI
jgi:predicted transcriptional regulator